MKLRNIKPHKNYRYKSSNPTNCKDIKHRACTVASMWGYLVWSIWRITNVVPKVEFENGQGRSSILKSRILKFFLAKSGFSHGQLNEFSPFKPNQTGNSEFPRIVTAFLSGIPLRNALNQAGSWCSECKK